MTVHRETLIEELVAVLPEAVSYLMQQGIRCMVCGEPMWGSIEQAAREKGFSAEQIETFVRDLNLLAERRNVQEDVWHS